LLEGGGGGGEGGWEGRHLSDRQHLFRVLPLSKKMTAMPQRCRYALHFVNTTVYIFKKLAFLFCHTSVAEFTDPVREFKKTCLVLCSLFPLLSNDSTVFSLSGPKYTDRV
jgi:hypothetical protein